MCGLRSGPVLEEVGQQGIRVSLVTGARARAVGSRPLYMWEICLCYVENSRAGGTQRWWYRNLIGCAPSAFYFFYFYDRGPVAPVCARLSPRQLPFSLSHTTGAESRGAS